jgi:hypothetical protein
MTASSAARSAALCSNVRNPRTKVPFVVSASVRCSRSVARRYPRSSDSGSAAADQRRTSRLNDSAPSCVACPTRKSSPHSDSGSASASRRSADDVVCCAMACAWSSGTSPRSAASAVAGSSRASARPSLTSFAAWGYLVRVAAASQEATERAPSTAHQPSASTTGSRSAVMVTRRSVNAWSSSTSAAASRPSRSRGSSSASISTAPRSIPMMSALVAAMSPLVRPECPTRTSVRTTSDITDACVTPMPASDRCGVAPMPASHRCGVAPMLLRPTSSAIRPQAT